MRPTLRQLQYFVAVAEHNAFGAAAQALAVSQPSLSKQLATMEDELGAPLFERTSRRVTLTPLGRLLLDRARLILQDVAEFKAVAKGSVGLFGDRLAIGVLPSIGAYFMPVANRRLHALFPKLRLVVQEGATTQLLDLLRAGKVDAVIGTPNNAPDFRSIPLFPFGFPRDRFTLAARLAAERGFRAARGAADRGQARDPAGAGRSV